MAGVFLSAIGRRLATERWQRLERKPDKMLLRRQTAEHPFGTFLMRGLPKVATGSRKTAGSDAETAYES